METDRDEETGEPRDTDGRLRRARWAIVGFAVAIMATIRLTLSFDDIANPDIAGILYNADLLRAGGLPYVDSTELKQPGAFFLFAAIFATLGRSIGAIQVVYALWLLLGAWAIARAARSLYPAASLSPAIAAAIWLLSAGQFDYNYSAWMTVPYAGAFASLLYALRRPGLRHHALAGALGAIACVFKAQAGVLVAVYGATWWWARRRGQPGARPVAAFAWLAGALAGLLPLVVIYAAAGELGALWQSKLGLAEASGYASGSTLSWPALLGEIAVQHARVFPFGTAVVAAAVAVWTMRRRQGPTPGLGPAAMLWLASIVACGLGGARFYAHYLVQYLPGIALVGAWPELWRTLAAWRGRTSGIAAAIEWGLRVAVVGALAWQLAEIPRGKGHRYDNVPRYIEGFTPAQAVGQLIATNSRPDETIFVWGLTAWPVYFWADRRAPTPVYKAMGQVTTYNTNTAFEPGSQIHFRPGPRADALVEAFRTRPPAFFVHADPWGSMGCAYDPLAEFSALRDELARAYVGVFRFGGLTVFERVDHARARGVAVAPPPGA